MARLNPIDQSQAPDKARELLEIVNKRMGMTPNFIRTLANSHRALRAYLFCDDTLTNGALPNQLRHQLSMMIAENICSEYCLAAHCALGKAMGLCEQDIMDARRANSVDPKFDAALCFAKAVLATHGQVSDKQFASVRRAGWSDEAITEMVAHIGLSMFAAYFNNIAETDIDFPKAPEIPAQAHTQ